MAEDLEEIQDESIHETNNQQSQLQIKSQQSEATKNFEQKFALLCDKSLFFIQKRWAIRRFAIKLVYWKAFDCFIISLIIINSALLGIMDYTDTENQSLRNKIVEKTEIFFIFAFTLEFLIQIVAKGFVLNKHTYLRDNWNILDFAVVTTSWLSLHPSLGNVSGLRTFRLLRPLRSIGSLKNMKMLIGTLLASISQLGEILLFSSFFFLIFAILSVSLWHGTIHFRCRETEFPVNGDWIPV